jgi:hypothetical protein
MKKAIMLDLCLAVIAAGAGPVLEFLEPAPDAVFLSDAEIPLVLRGEAPDEIVSGAEVFVDGQSVGTAVYCCPLCRCAAPTEGMPLVLQLPAPVDEFPGGLPWQGLTGLAPGIHRITARAVASGGTVLDAAARSITVLPIRAEDLVLSVSSNPAGSLDFVLPGGSLVPGGFAMWLSHDLVHWTRLGEFSPGNVAAFFSDAPEPMDPRPCFYRAVSETVSIPGVGGL